MYNSIQLIPEDKDIEFFIDKPVIVITNEWRNPIIGFVNDIDKEKNSLVVYDYISDKEVTVNSRTFIFTEQRYQLVIKLDPFELCSILYPEECFETDFRKDKREFLLNPEEINSRLRQNCFWKDLLEYREETIEQA